MRVVQPPASRRTRPVGLASLRGFEAAGRLLSFTRAAAELKLTQSSISRQVAAFEQQVGKRLFIRRTRALELTAAGSRLLHAVQAALQQVDRAVDEVRGRHHPRRVTVTTYASFASLWLVPRLARFQRDHPEIEIRIDAGDRMVNLESEGVDLAIRWARPASMPGDARRLHDDEVTPALSPLLLERSKIVLRTARDLFELPLLDLDDSVPSSAVASWARWLAFAGVKATPPAPRLLFTFIDQSVQAAVRGQGVVLVRSPFADDLAASGDLLIPFPKLRLRTGYQYALIDNPTTRDAPHVRSFSHWIEAEFRRGADRKT